MLEEIKAGLSLIIAEGELGCSTELPAISEATLPKAVVVVVAAIRTPFRASLKMRLVSRAWGVDAWAAFRVSDRPRMSLELRYSVTRTLIANFCSASLSAYDSSWNFQAIHWMENFSNNNKAAQRKSAKSNFWIRLMIWGLLPPMAASWWL